MEVGGDIDAWVVVVVFALLQFCNTKLVNRAWRDAARQVALGDTAISRARFGANANANANDAKGDKCNDHDNQENSAATAAPAGVKRSAAQGEGRPRKSRRLRVRRTTR